MKRAFLRAVFLACATTSLGQIRVVSPSRDWNETGPQGPGGRGTREAPGEGRKSSKS
jgi:hypothetical protein